MTEPNTTESLADKIAVAFWNEEFPTYDFHNPEVNEDEPGDMDWAVDVKDSIKSSAELAAKVATDYFTELVTEPITNATIDALKARIEELEGAIDKRDDIWDEIVTKKDEELDTSRKVIAAARELCEECEYEVDAPIPFTLREALDAYEQREKE